jgi:hypothetical protein
MPDRADRSRFPLPISLGHGMLKGTCRCTPSRRQPRDQIAIHPPPIRNSFPVGGFSVAIAIRCHRRKNEPRTRSPGLVADGWEGQMVGNQPPPPVVPPVVPRAPPPGAPDCALSDPGARSGAGWGATSGRGPLSRPDAAGSLSEHPASSTHSATVAPRVSSDLIMSMFPFLRPAGGSCGEAFRRRSAVLGW